jgi:hypothetical protein
MKAFVSVYCWSALLTSRSPLRSSGQSSWLQIQRPGYDSRHYQKKKVVGLERGPLSLVSTTEELLDRKVAASVYKTENTAVGIRHADHVAPSIRKSWQPLRRQAAVARSVQFARGLRPWSLVFLVSLLTSLTETTSCEVSEHSWNCTSANNKQNNNFRSSGSHDKPRS